MVVKQSRRFKTELKRITDYISKDSIARAKEFQRGLKDRLESLKEMPLACRKSVLADNENIRELIYKGYVVVYFVSDDVIMIQGIYKGNLWNI
ncbi:type II toxin-antitoxin system RelE/ParE family toxin [Campylobacter curvus]|uniref:type II toxin-antitoxin system RelE/ParE family toxin n=1 Tax=Campylobacter curvus TaxID=200 RepID=UPI00147079CB